MPLVADDTPTFVSCLLLAVCLGVYRVVDVWSLSLASVFAVGRLLNGLLILAVSLNFSANTSSFDLCFDRLLFCISASLLMVDGRSLVLATVLLMNVALAL